ncbi:PREDICTED: tectonic-3 isoform X4 [Calidris pugnax]|uniref:tectonic-3 isoform X4 n=1 Tax=Calidris pugnax TaxID=198806 RepID=UPI00071DEB8D|nr:PREDICTED: tectonic-3 isoform X4 [Calidris pugnax]
MRPPPPRLPGGVVPQRGGVAMDGARGFLLVLLLPPLAAGTPAIPLGTPPGTADTPGTAPATTPGTPLGTNGFSRPSGGGRSVSRVCVEHSLVFRSNTPYPTDTIAVPGGHDLFCVQLDDCFLDSKSTSCTRIFANLSKSCSTDPALDAASYYRDFTVLKVPVNDIIVQSMQVKVSAVAPPGAPHMEHNTCINVVSEVIYEIEFSGTRGIQSVSVRFKVSNVSGNSGSSLQQHFTLHFWTRTLSHTLPRSGNPGYITGAPLLIANSGAMQHMNILQSEGDGSCSQFLRHTAQFARNMRTGCKLSLSPILEESNCSYIQQKLYRALQGMDRAEDLAVIGSAHSTQAEEWTAILIRDCSVQAVNCTSCCMVPVTLEIQILWTKVGLLSNPQAQILGARYFYQCRPLKFPSTSMVPLTTGLTFTDMTEWPEPPRGQPQIHWKLPFDIFFPFKVALNLERSYRDDLAGYFFFILIISSILCF